MDRSDEELVRDTLDGEVSAYDILVSRYHRRVVYVAYRALRDASLAEDLAQEVFLRAYRSLGRFQMERRFGPWLMAIAGNRIRDHLKARKRRNEITWEPDRPTGSDDVTPLQQAESRQLLRRVVAGIEDMPDETQDVLRLRFVLGLDYEEVASALELPLGTVKSRISRARGALRLLLKEELS
jgi:RNA polymerase sigma-70 factor (ECF subfamily)